MEFKRESFKHLRKQKKLTAEEVAEKAGIHRVTLTVWENGKRIPSEKHVRLLAYVLDVPLSEISDLEDDYPQSDGNFSKLAESWQSFAGIEQKNIIDNFGNCIKQLQKQHNEFRNASVIMNSLLSVMHTMFYVKDTNLDYITANEAFIKNAGLNIDFSPVGKNDSNILPTKEATENTEEDRSVLQTGYEIKKESYIPGSRKKKWGIIRKIPIFDVNNKIAGVIGTFVDITDRKKSELKRQLLENSINRTDDMFWIAKLESEYSNNFKYLFINNAVENIFNISQEDFNDIFWSEGVHKDFKHLVDINVKEIKDFPLEYEYKFIKPDGKIRKLRDKVFKHEEYYFGTVRDVTVLDEVQHIKDMLISVLAKVLDYHVWIVDFSDGTKKIIQSGTENRMFDIYGYSIEEFTTSKGDLWKKIVVPEDLQNLMTTFTKGPYPKTITYRIKDKQGAIRKIQDHIIKHEIEGSVLFLGLAKRIE